MTEIGAVGRAGRPSRRRGGFALVLLTLGWVVGTAGFFVAAVGRSFCVFCSVSTHERLVADWLIIGSTVCAFVFPVAAVLVCTRHGRRTGTVLYLLGAALGLAYCFWAGPATVRDIQRLHPPRPPVPSSYCACRSGGGSCDCPGG